MEFYLSMFLTAGLLHVLEYFHSVVLVPHRNMHVLLCSTLLSCTVPAGASHGSKAKGPPVGDLPGTNPPQKTGSEASLQPVRLTNQRRLEH